MIPVVHPEAFVHPGASLIGDVIIGAGCYIGPAASLRGDFGRIVIEPGSNIQDTCVLHSTPGADMIVEANGHIGHGAILHGCRIGNNVLVGINAVVMDDAVIGESSIIGASTFIKTGFNCNPRCLIMGIPGKVVRELTVDECAWKRDVTSHYQRLAVRCLQSFREVTPLTEVEPDRKRLGSEGKFQKFGDAGDK
jgi:phenylacetic acid degradation protein